MKKIINGRLYDTEKAQLVGNWESPDITALDYLKETLYRKRTGEFFLYGEGGPRTRYASRTWDGWGSGENIVPLPYDAAQAWAEKNLPSDIYEQFFKLDDDEGVSTTTLRLPTSVFALAKRAASQANMTSFSAYIEQLIINDNKNK